MISRHLRSTLFPYTTLFRSVQKSSLNQIKKGWKDLLSTPILRKIAVMEILETIAGTVWIAAILYVFVNEALQVGEAWWGFINGSFFLGLIVASIYCIKYYTLVEENQIGRAHV